MSRDQLQGTPRTRAPLRVAAKVGTGFNFGAFDLNYPDQPQAIVGPIIRWLVMRERISLTTDQILVLSRQIAVAVYDCIM